MSWAFWRDSVDSLLKDVDDEERKDTDEPLSIVAFIVNNDDSSKDQFVEDDEQK